MDNIIKKNFVICLILCSTGCGFVFIEKDYYADKDADKFIFKPNKVYISKVDFYIYDDDVKTICVTEPFNNHVVWVTPEEDKFIGTLNKGTKFIASRLRRTTTYLVPFIFPYFNSLIWTYCEILDGPFKGQEIKVDLVLFISDLTYTGRKPDSACFKEVDNFENIKPTINGPGSLPKPKISFEDL